MKPNPIIIKTADSLPAKSGSNASVQDYTQSTIPDPCGELSSYAVSTCDLRLGWDDKYVRELIELSIRNGNFKDAPELAEAFIKKIDTLCKSPLSSEQIYTELRQCFYDLCGDPKLQCSFSNDKSERVQRRILTVIDLLCGFTPRSMVDVGCGDGDFTGKLKDKLQLPNQKVSGCEVFVRPDSKSSCRIEKFDGIRLPFPDESLDLVTFFAVLHHAEDMNALLDSTYRVLSKNGHVVIREFDSPTVQDKTFQLLMDKMLYEVYTPYPDVPIPGYYFSTEKWERIFNEHGFIVKNKTYPEPLNPYKPVMFDLVKR